MITSGVALLPAMNRNIVPPPTTQNNQYLLISQAQIAGEKVCASPPVNVNPLTITSIQAAYYGLPDPHMYVGHQNEWVYLVKHSKHRWCKVTIETNPNVQFGIFNTTALNWSGYSSVNSTGYTNFQFNAARGEFNMGCTSSGQDAIWVGIGRGDYIKVNDPLWQAGWETTNHTFFAEWVQSDNNGNISGWQVTIHPTKFAPQCNDEGYGFISDTPATGLYAYVGDMTMDSYGTLPYPNKYSGTEHYAAEWIADRGACTTNGIITGYATWTGTLPNIDWSNADYWNNLGYSAYVSAENAPDVANYTMVVNNTDIAGPFDAFWSPDSFTDYDLGVSVNGSC